MPCIFDIFTVDPAPTILFSAGDQIAINATTTLRIQCMKTNTSTTYDQVTDLGLDIDIELVLNITDNFTLQLKASTVGLTITSVSNNTVQVKRLVLINTELSALTLTVKTLINQKLGDGVPIGQWLIDHGLAFLDLTYLAVQEADGYIVILLTPQYRRLDHQYILTD